MSVRKNIELPLRVRKVPGAEIRRRVDETLQLCRLDGFADRDPHQLSGGQLQRVALARALVYRPRLVLLDEPLSNLDVALREDLRREIGRLHKLIGATFVLVTHDQVEAMSLSDRVVVMRQGRIEQIGAPEEIYRSPRTEFVAQFVGAANLLQGSIVAAAATDSAADAAAAAPARCRVRVGGLTLAVRAWAGAAEGEAATLAVHPEVIRILAPGQGDRAENLFEGTVRAAYFLGRTQEIVVDVEGVELRTVQVRSETFHAGQPVLLSIPGDAIIPLGRQGQGAAARPSLLS
jgi:ABC-type Fe3+/spermidine/putrescine transport system ATPase subunit